MEQPPESEQQPKPSEPLTDHVFGLNRISAELERRGRDEGTEDKRFDWSIFKNTTKSTPATLHEAVKKAKEEGSDQIVKQICC